MPTDAIYLSLGSNSGDRAANIDRALHMLDTGLGTPRTALSTVIETKSWGFDGPDFLNCAVRYDNVTLSPQELLCLCKTIEAALGRTGSPEYAPDGSRIYRDRPIDIDILLYGNLRLDTPELTIPHPRMHERDFVTIPLNEIRR